MSHQSLVTAAITAGNCRAVDITCAIGASLLMSADGTKALAINSSGQLIDSAGSATLAVTALTDGATIAWTWTPGGNNLASVTLGGNRTLAIAGHTIGDEGWLQVTQDGTGSRTLTQTGALHPALTTSAAGVDVLHFKCVAANTWYVTMGKTAV
jgi:hypothetical protein